jgi:hypothetical protein
MQQKHGGLRRPVCEHCTRGRAPVAHLDRNRECLQLDFLTPATSRLPAEAQHGLKQWLIELSWYGWATASEELRAYAVAGVGPQPHKHASDISGIHFSTLTKAAREAGCQPFPPAIAAWSIVPRSRRQWAEVLCAPVASRATGMLS